MVCGRVIWLSGNGRIKDTVIDRDVFYSWVQLPQPLLTKNEIQCILDTDSKPYG